MPSQATTFLRLQGSKLRFIHSKTFRSGDCFTRLIHSKLWICQAYGSIQIINFDLQPPVTNIIARRWQIINDVTALSDGSAVLCANRGLFHLQADGSYISWFSKENNYFRVCFHPSSSRLFVAQDFENSSAIVQGNFNIKCYEYHQSKWIKLETFNVPIHGEGINNSSMAAGKNSVIVFLKSTVKFLIYSPMGQKMHELRRAPGISYPSTPMSWILDNVNNILMIDQKRRVWLYDDRVKYWQAESTLPIEELSGYAQIVGVAVVGNNLVGRTIPERHAFLHSRQLNSKLVGTGNIFCFMLLQKF